MRHFAFLHALLLSLALAACLEASGALHAAQSTNTPGLQAADPANPLASLWLIPSGQPGLLMRATLFRPPGNGPFPLAIINHGSEQDVFRRDAMPMPAYGALTDWFVRKGYAVLVPQRPGHGKTGGRYFEDQGSCRHPDYARAGNTVADNIAAAIAYMAKETFVKPNAIVVVGHSAGAWGALALAARNPPNVRAIVNFSGGRGGRQYDRPLDNCAPERLVAVAGEYGHTARTPTLWLYAANDTFFAPDLSARMAEAFRLAGGDAEYHLIPPIQGEGHLLIQASGPGAPWIPYLETFLRKRLIGGN